jgi:transglutaminase-like putative cysteine protease
VRFMLAVQLTLLAVVVDLLAVVARRPALAGVPFLLLFTIAGAVPRQAVSWVWFGLAAVGYLLLLGSDARDELAHWGRFMPRNAGGSRAAVQALSARRIGLIAIALAVIAPIVLPMRSSNVLADALHGGGGGGGKGGVSLSPFATLKGQLDRRNAQTLLDVSTNGLDGNDPFYLRQVVLDQFDASGWRQGDTGRGQPLDSTQFASDPGTDQPNFAGYSATVTIDNLDDVEAPIFQSPTHIDGLSKKWSWSGQDAVLVGSRIKRGDRYTERVAEPRPTVSQLEEAKEPTNLSALGHWLQFPANMPPRVVALVKRLVAKSDSPYSAARAIFDYFRPSNGFSYSLSTKAGDSGSDLEDFLLVGKAGFCQQYAASMAIMLRMAHVPSRVVIGYTHAKPDRNGSFTITTSDAHAWVEAYFDGLGWVPFDPTPLVGIDAGRAATVPWAPHPSLSVPNASGPASSSSANNTAAQKKDQTLGAGAKAGQSGSGTSIPLWGVALLVSIGALVFAIVLFPALVRRWRRRGRLRAAARGPDPLWQELADTAVDLGYVWSPMRSPRQVVSWLRREGGLSDDARDSLRSLATAVEVSRYAAPGHDSGDTVTMVDDLRQVERSLREQRSGWERTRARLLPDSLGWVRRLRWRGHH